MTDKLISIEKKIQRLKENRNRLYTRQTILFYKEVEKIFKNGFCPALVLDILTKTYETASALQQQEWKERAHSFRAALIPLQALPLWEDEAYIYLQRKFYVLKEFSI